LQKAARWCLRRHSYRNRNDLDLVVDPSAENRPARRSAAADLRSQFGHLAFVSPRVDVVESLQGVALEEAFRAAVTIECQAGHVPVLALHHIIANKRFMWRQKDIEDLAYLPVVLSREADANAVWGCVGINRCGAMI